MFPSTMCHLALFIILLKCFMIMTFVSGDFKIAIMVENGLINETLVASVLSQRTPAYHNHTADIIYVDKGDSVAAVQKLCTNTTALWGVLAIGRQQMLNALAKQATCLGIPYVGIPSSPLEREPDPIVKASDWNNPLAINWMHIAEAAADVVNENDHPNGLVIYDETADRPILYRAINSLWNHTIRLTMLRMSNVPTDTALAAYFQNNVKGKLRSIFVMVSEANLTRIFTQANRTSIMQQHYFWTVLDTNLVPASFLPLLPAYANVAFVRGVSFPSSGVCPKYLHHTFGACDLSQVKYLDVQLVSHLELLLNAINNVVTANVTSSVGGDCSLATALDIGPVIQETMKNMTYANYVLAPTAASVEVLATVTREKPAPRYTVFERSALWSPEGKLHWTTGNDRYLRLFPNTFLGWKNRSIVICAPPVSPYLWYTGKGPIYTMNETHGMMREILEYIIPKLEITPIVRIAADDKWGAPVDGSEIFTGCVGELQLGLATIGASVFTYTEARSQVVDYIFPLFDDANNVLLQLPTSDGGVWNVYRPLKYSVWLLIVVMIMFASLVGYILAKYSPVSAYNLGLSFAIRDEIYPQEHLWNVIGSFLQQGQDFYPYAPSARAVLGIWWLFTLIIFSAYTADLTSFLTIQTVVKDINSLDDLAKQTRVRPYLAQGTNIDSLLESSTIEVFQKLNKMKVYAVDATECGQAILKPENAHLACFMDYTGLLYLAKNFCDKVYLLPDLFNNAPVGWIAPKDAYYFDFVQFHMQRMSESGLIDIWFTKNFIGPGDMKCGSSGTQAPSLNLSGVGGVFIVSLSLYVIGAGFLIFEMVFIKCCDRSTREFPGFG